MTVTGPNDSAAADQPGTDAGTANDTIGYAGPTPPGPPPEVPNAPAGRIDWAVIAVRLAAVWCFYSAVPLLYSLPLLFAGSDGFPWSYRLSVFVPHVVSLGLGIALWAAARGLARWMLADVPPVGGPAGPAVPPAQQVSAADAQAVCFSVAGAIFAVYALRYLPYAFFPADEFGTIQPGVNRGYLIQFVVEAAAGAGLFFGARGLSNLWHRVRAGPDAHGNAGVGSPGDSATGEADPR